MKKLLTRKILLLPLLLLALLLPMLTGCADVLDLAIELLEEDLYEEDTTAADLGGDTDIPESDRSPVSRPTSEPESEITEVTAAPIDRGGEYTSRDDVALYIYTYHALPKNFLTKDEARDLGWSGGSLEPYAPGCAIGGDYFGNYEGLLPEDKEYRECDIDTVGASSRGAKRIVYASDFSAIYSTDDHYESFERLY